MARETARLRREAAQQAGRRPDEIEKLTQLLAPFARSGGGTEGDMLVLVHQLTLHASARPGDIGHAVNTTLARVESGHILGLHGLPMKRMVKDPAPLVDACYLACSQLWPSAYAKWEVELRARDLQVRHARMVSGALLVSEYAELEALEQEMAAAGVAPDEELVAKMRAATRTADASEPQPRATSSRDHLPRRRRP